jgi:nitrous oxidase accessory protein
VIDVPGDYETLSAAISAGPDGAIIRVAPGTYAEQIVIERPLTLIAEQGRAELRGLAAGSVIDIFDTNEVTIRGLTVVGGDIGISVRNSSGVTISQNLVLGSQYRGVQVLNGAANVSDNKIRPAQEPYVIGIRIANASTWPRSLVSGNVIEQVGAYGIAVNFAHATVVDNIVRGGQRAGIAINEMSTADVADNAVSDAPRYGILVTDMSHAVVTRNEVVGALEPIKLQYHSVAELADNWYR